MQGRSKPIALEPLTVVRILGSITVLLLLAHLAVQLVRFIWGHPYAQGLVPMFDLDQENNIPTFYSSSLLLLCSGLIAIIAVFKKRQRDSFARQWVILAIIMLYLSVDEASSIHELLSLVTNRFIDARGFLYHSWVIPGAAFVAVFSALYWRFVWHLPVRTRCLFLASAFVYLTGALVLELWGGRQNHLHGRNNMTYGMFVMLEEGLEMTGAIMFAYALLDYMRIKAYDVFLRIGPDSKEKGPGAVSSTAGGAG